MKPNFPLTIKKAHVYVLHFLIFTSLVQAGSQFNTCLGSDKYNTLFTFASNIPDNQTFCCNGDCSTEIPCPYYGPDRGQCRIINGARFCIVSGAYDDFLSGLPPGDLCGGILGNTLISNNISVGTCPSSQAIENALNISSTTSTSSWLCCNNNSCEIPSNVVMNSNNIIVETNCAANQYALMCFQDNGGWICTGSIGPNVDNVYQPMGSCVKQIVLQNVVSHTLPGITGETPNPTVTIVVYTSASTSLIEIITGSSMGEILLCALICFVLIY